MDGYTDIDQATELPSFILDCLAVTAAFSGGRPRQNALMVCNLSIAGCKLSLAHVSDTYIYLHSAIVWMYPHEDLRGCLPVCCHYFDYVRMNSHLHMNTPY